MDHINSRSDSLVNQTTDALRRMIVEGDLQLGEALSEARVAKWLKVSRTPVREAFAKLQLEGLVVSEPQRRTCVFFPTSKDLDDICDARCCLETRALTLAVERNREKLGNILKETFNLMDIAMNEGNSKEYLRLDIEFHQAIFDCADNTFLNDAYQTIAAKLAAFRTRLATHRNYVKKGIAEHQSLGGLVSSGDLTTALAVLEGHISRSADSYWRLNIRPASAGMRHDHPEYDELVGEASSMFSSIINRRNDAIAVSSEGEYEREAYEKPNNVDENEKEIDDKASRDNSLDENRRGRPRIYEDDAARKRAWATQWREQKQRERKAQGQPAPKRGRPRKSASVGLVSPGQSSGSQE